MDIKLINAKVFQNGKLLDLEVGIEQNMIAQVGLELGEAERVIDLKGKTILPGVIDSQVHFRDPGLNHKESIETGSRAAALGGVTAFFDMPNTKPATCDSSRIQEKVEIGKRTSFVNFGFYIGANGENLEELKKAHLIPGCVGVKIFLGSSTGELLLYDQDKLIEIFENVKCPIAVHSENEELLVAKKSIRDNADNVHAHYEWRDVEVALSSTKQIIEIAKKTKKKVHILHISTQEEVEFLAENKEYCTFEMTPQHLSFSAPLDYERMNTFMQMNPPIREGRHKEALLKSLKKMDLDIIGSDHAPHLKEEKLKGYPHSPSGMPGVQTLVPVMLDLVNKGALTLEDFVKLTCQNVVDLFSLQKRGRIETGYFADLTIVDLNQKFQIEDKDQATKCGWTPFNGMELTGKPHMTIVNGKVVMENGVLYDSSPVSIR